MLLYLLQHGLALSKEQDPERPLSEEGRSDIEKTGHFLFERGVVIQRIVHSGKLRAAETAEIIARSCGIDAIEPMDGMNPNDDVLEFWSSRSHWRQDAMMVGHLPFLARLTSHLLDAGIDRPKVEFLPGAMVCLDVHAGGLSKIQWMIRLELLPIPGGIRREIEKVQSISDRLRETASRHSE